MRRAPQPLAVLLLCTLALAGCGQKGPLCLQEPKPATVAVSAPASTSESSAPSAAATAPAAPAVASRPAPLPPRVPGYTRCH
jgi:predicted small lipoprotein YifL